MTEKILLAHGDGGKLTHDLVDSIFAKHFYSSDQVLPDAFVADNEEGRIAFTTDTFVVNPLFFKGGDIGKIAIAGTVNDLAVVGAIPKYISCGFIIEEGFSIADLEKIVVSMAKTANEAQVKIVTGDTKVVEKNKGDGVFINTSGIGFIPLQSQLSYRNIAVGDAVLINGNIGEHGMAIMSERSGLNFSSPVQSDCQALNLFIKKLMEHVPDVRFMRDPTRGGIATTLKEIAVDTRLNIIIDEESLPVSDELMGAADLLGLDPLYLANEGKVLVFVPEHQVELALEIMRSMPEGIGSTQIAKVEEGNGQVFLQTAFGGKKIIDLLAGAPLPRIC
ncbi:hydrogenase expression/formation protein HypE [Desulfuribacillus stibiiarsenatis]|uniref:Hydrogenase expression/formation protein HypE n=1 Tax=Desulfuribacillus stibiiarsenatis TaxID=1390249 RepID=A0A1E5L358_9FIRM|nr:hydrogenase expression/formation protein HypE [Desulfuribacillus stibiiarsenatis]OEH84369.1 hydrogenase expression/formation protein HypE [Desulfuribacillus stibiiarsenatis]